MPLSGEKEIQDTIKKIFLILESKVWESTANNILTKQISVTPHQRSSSNTDAYKTFQTMRFFLGEVCSQLRNIFSDDEEKNCISFLPKIFYNSFIKGSITVEIHANRPQEREKLKLRCDKKLKSVGASELVQFNLGRCPHILVGKISLTLHLIKSSLSAVRLQSGSKMIH